jgi:hypothetical protein
LFLDLAQQQWVQVNAHAHFPTARSFHATAITLGAVFMFGGADSAGSVLGDTWQAALQASGDQTQIESLAWRPVTSAAAPPPRSHHAMVAVNGQIFLFGGLASARRVSTSILGDLWAFQTPSTWRPVTASFSSSSSVPTGRYGHALAAGSGASSNLVYMFGGVSTAGFVDELWQLDASAGAWTQIALPFENALWPTPRAYHTLNAIEVIVTADMMRVVQNYSATAKSAAARMLAAFPDAAFPYASDPDELPSVEYGASVNRTLDAAIARLSVLREGSAAVYLVAYGGTTDAIGLALGEIWVFDTVSQLWHVPVRVPDFLFPHTFAVHLFYLLEFSDCLVCTSSHSRRATLAPRSTLSAGASITWRPRSVRR